MKHGRRVVGGGARDHSGGLDAAARCRCGDDGPGAQAPDAVVVNADAFVPAAGPDHDHLFRSWADHMVAHGISEADAWQHFDEWAEEDTYQPLEVELSALRGLGFDAEQTWSDGPMGVLVARKPA